MKFVSATLAVSKLKPSSSEGRQKWLWLENCSLVALGLEVAEVSEVLLFV